MSAMWEYLNDALSEGYTDYEEVVETTGRLIVADDPEVVTEHDIETDGIYPLEYEDEETLRDWEYWQEVNDCCKGTDPGCGHWRYCSDLDDRFTYREDN